MNRQPVTKNLLMAFGVIALFFAGTTDSRFGHADSLSKQLEAAELRNEKEGENRSDRPDEALRFRRLQLQDERGHIPPDGLEKARQHVKLMKQAQQERIRKGIAPQAAGIKPDSWTWLGPGNIGGRIRAIVISPTNANNMWIGSVAGGIWRSTDAGASWQPVDDFLANLAVSTMVVSPVNPNIMYAGTGEVFANSNPPGIAFFPPGLLGAGIFRSTDGGVSWNQLPNTDPNIAVCPNPANCPWFSVNRLAVSPNGNTILAATGIPSASLGIMRSTDAGVNWNQANGVNGVLLDIDFDPTNNQRAIASATQSAFFSTDGGQNWTFANFNPALTAGRVEVAYAPSNPTIVYASVDQNNGEIYRSTDGGQTFARVNTGTNFFFTPGPPPASQGFYDNIIWVNPLDPTFIVVGGIDLWRSTNSGSSFTRISTWQIAPLSAHADHHMIVGHPGFNNSTNRIAYVGNDGGIYRADDIAAVPIGGIPNYTGWVELNNNLGITQFYGAAGNAGSGVIIGGAQDNGTVRYAGGGTESWGMPRGGDGGYCAADPTDSNYFYGEYIYLTIYRSTNGGQSFTDIFAGIGEANANGANFIAPFMLDPNEPNTMLAGGASLWRSNDVKSSATPSWTSIKVPDPLPQPPPNLNPVSAIAVAPGNSAFICVGHNNGALFLTFNGTAESPVWTRIDTAAVPNNFVTRLVIDSTRTPTWIYATFGGFNNNNIFRTTDFGSTWVDVSGTGVTGLPSVPVRALAIHPHNANLLYAGTEIGIFTSEDAGANWEPTQDGPANVSVDELLWMGADLIAATHGRGLYHASGGVYVDCNYDGIEIGTFNQPFRTITSAITATTLYRAIWIKPCNYNETISTNKRLELRALGSPVIIGKP